MNYNKIETLRRVIHRLKEEREEYANKEDSTVIGFTLRTIDIKTMEQIMKMIDDKLNNVKTK